MNREERKKQLESRIKLTAIIVGAIASLISAVAELIEALK